MCNLTHSNLVYQGEGHKQKGSGTVTDHHSVSLFWNRDEDAIAATDALYGRKLRSLSRRILQNPEDSEEVVNDTYMKTWSSIPDARPQYFYAYIAAICRHLSLNLLNWNQAAKRKAEVVSLTEEMAMCIPDRKQEAETDAMEIGKILDAFLESISQESRVIFLRRYWFCDTIAEIAERYSISESKVKTRLHRTRTQLAGYLDKEGISI